MLTVLQVLKTNTHDCGCSGIDFGDLNLIIFRRQGVVVFVQDGRVVGKPYGPAIFQDPLGAHSVRTNFLKPVCIDAIKSLTNVLPEISSSSDLG